MTIRHLSATEASRSDSMPKADFVNPHKRIELPPQQARCWILPIESILAAPDPVRHHQFQPKCCLADLRSEEHTSELQSLRHLVCRLLLAKKITSQNLINPLS